jgi:hypothetical protein
MTTLTTPALIPSGSVLTAAKIRFSSCTWLKSSMKGRKFVPHHPRIYSAKRMSTPKFGIFHTAGGTKAYSVGIRASHTKNRGKRMAEIIIGAMNDACDHPYAAPDVRATTRRRTEPSILTLVSIGCKRCQKLTVRCQECPSA